MVDKSQKIQNYYWWPLENVNKTVECYCKKNNYKNILEIGPGDVPFSLSTTSIGYSESIKNYIELDIDTNKLPFENKSFDFVYSRHTLEDIQSPDFAMSEIIRVSNSGYIETPSPLIEVTKGIDNFQPYSDNYAGYIHHRYLIWSDIEKCEIYFLPKYNTIIDNFIVLNIDMKYYDNPLYWNNYFIWKDKTPKMIMYKNCVNFNSFNSSSNIVEDYTKLVEQAVCTSVLNANYFNDNYILDS